MMAASGWPPPCSLPDASRGKDGSALLNQALASSPAILAYAAGVAGPVLAIEPIAATPLTGGHVAAAVWRHRLRIRLANQAWHELSVVEKRCAAAEVRVMRVIAGLPDTDALPALIDAAIRDGPGRPNKSWFISPYYPGHTLGFGDPIPNQVIPALARVHAAWQDTPAPDGIVTFDRGHMESLLTNALAALDNAAPVRGLPPGQAELRHQLAGLRDSPVLFAATDDLPKTLTHGDMHPGNIILQPDGEPVIIDWGNARLAPAPLDLANIIAIDSPAWETYVTAHAAAGGVTGRRTLRRGYHWARAATGLMYLPWAIRHLATAPDLIRQVVAADHALRTA